MIVKERCSQYFTGKGTCSQYFKVKLLPDVAKLVESLDQISLHHGVAESSDVDDGGRGDAVIVLHTDLQTEKS